MNLDLMNLSDAFERAFHNLSMATPLNSDAYGEFRKSLQEFREEIRVDLPDTFIGVRLIRSAEKITNQLSATQNDNIENAITHIKSLTDNLREALNEIDYHRMADDRLRPKTNTPSEEAIKFTSELSLLKESTSILTKDFESKISGYENKISELKKISDDLEKKIHECLERAQNTYQEALDDTLSKKNNLQELMALTGETVLKGRYLEKSENEKSTANLLRIASSIFLVTASIFMIYALYKSAAELLSYPAILQKISIAIFLTLPAAYFARESSKHRELQNLYSQKALALATIDHYTNSLPAEEVHKIKSQLAPTLFNPSLQTAQDPFPVNSQELLVELIKKLDFKKDSKP